MSDRPSRDGHTIASTGVDDEVKRRIREAYLNDEARELVVTAVRSAGDEVVVELQPQHGEERHLETFSAPKHGSLADSAAFLAFLDAAGVSPLDIDELVGTRIPATYDAATGWRLDEAYVAGPADDETQSAGPWTRSVGWLRAHRKWLLAILLVAGELLFVAVIIVVYA